MSFLQKEPIQSLLYHCSEFLEESGGIPVYKTLPDSYNYFSRVKLRHRKRESLSINIFNESFRDLCSSIYQRSLVAYPNTNELIEQRGYNIFYIFPVNGYRFMFSNTITNTHTELENILNDVAANISEHNIGDSSCLTDAVKTDIIIDLVRLSYNKNATLYEALNANSEILFYNIPAFFAVRADCVKYAELYNTLSDLAR